MSQYLKRNMGLTDRIIRITIGIALLYIGFIRQDLVGNDIINLLIGLFGILNVAAGFTAHCPVYTLADFSTRKHEANDP